MIVVFEGAPAIGKTTLSLSMAELGATRVPEVNELFERPVDEAKDWYLESQIQRWRLAKSKNGLRILDGDIFQPIWFSWMYPDRVGYNWKYAFDFFWKKRDKFNLPSLIIVFKIAEEKRRQRELRRCELRGLSMLQATRKVDRYSNFSDLQSTYFNALAENFPSWIQIITADPKISHIQGILESDIQVPDQNKLLEAIHTSLVKLS